ncbi:MAG: hypothetical protein KJO81_01605 [Gammaproteobacteria bacterium]|nr:hypothetical protein [Gammaproteobacteria bacterium]
METFGEEAGIVVEYLKAMNMENERAMRAHQTLLQQSIDYLYEVRKRNKEGQMSIRDALLKLQNVEAVKKIKNPEKIFKQLSSTINLNKIPDENTRLMVGALINIGSIKTDRTPVWNGDLINESINRLLKVHQETNNINQDRDLQLQHQLQDALAMFNVIDNDPHIHPECTSDPTDYTIEYPPVEPSEQVGGKLPSIEDAAVPDFLKRGETRTSGSKDKVKTHSAP